MIRTRWRRERSSFRYLIAGIVVLAVATTVVACDRTAVDAAQTLTWSPPAGWESFEEVVIPAGGGLVELAADRDYRIRAPETITAPVHIRGGRHVVWIGGHISIDYFADRPGATERRALLIDDHSSDPSVQGRIVHLEGLLMDGNDLSEGINMAAPSATVQIQNVRVSAVVIRGADDRDGTNGYTNDLNHADVIQPWGGYGEIRIDGLSGYSNYQGLYLLQDIGNPTQGDVHIRRMNIESIETTGEDGISYAGHIMYRWDPAKTGQQFLDTGTVWVKHHPNSGWTDQGVDRHAYRNGAGELIPDPPPGNSRIENNLYIFGDLGSDGIGSYVAWTDTLNDGRIAVRNWTDTGQGKIYSGRPPGGDYVSESSVGLGYTSPGYGAGGGETQTTTVEAGQDAFVRASTPSFGGGERKVLKTRNDPEAIIYLRFEVPDTIGEEVDSATLRLRVRSEKDTRVVVRKAAAGAWSESGIDFTNRPALKRRLDVVDVPPRPGWIEVDVSDLVDGPGSYNIAVVGRRSASGFFFSRETSFTPELLVTSR